MKHPFEYHRPDPDQVQQIETVRQGCKTLHTLLLALPASAERTLAVRKLEECSMWANKGIILANESPVASEQLPENAPVYGSPEWLAAYKDMGGA
jgi:hypothetical protein